MKTRVLLMVILLITCSKSIADIQVFEVWGPAGQGAGIEIMIENRSTTVNFEEGMTTNQMADSIIKAVNNRKNIYGHRVAYASRVGNRITIRSIDKDEKIRIEKVNVANTRVNSAAYSNGQTQISRNNLFQFTGLANGDGMILFQNGDLSLSLATLPGQSPMEIVDALTDALHEIVPDDGLYSFGMEFDIASLDQTNIPIGSVDLGIWALGNRNLLLTECTSTDTGITVSQDPVITETIPTLTEWGLIFLVLATMGIGVFRIIKI